MSAELLTQAIEGKDIDGLQDKLITIINNNGVWIQSRCGVLRFLGFSFASSLRL
jgi:hypothetical protein